MGRARMSSATETSVLPREERRPYPVARLLDGNDRAIFFDSPKCIGCRLCVDACKDWNDLPRGNQYAVGSSTWITIEPPLLEGQSTIWGRKSCMHCEYPVCAAVCPVEAITKYEEGPVVIDRAACIGCDYCLHACPWQVIASHEASRKAVKCTMCSDRLKEGSPPFCVQACPVGAMEFGPAEDVEKKLAERSAEVSARSYGQGEAGGSHVLHLLTAPLEQHGMLAVSGSRYPGRQIPLATKLLGLLTPTGGLPGKWRAATNAVSKPWRLKYRYGRPSL